MVRRTFLLILLLLSLPTLLRAQSDTTYVLPDVTVTATRSTVNVAEAPMRVTVLDARTLEQAATSSVADLLASRTGLFVKRYGSGGLATPSLRGASASQTLVLLDGHRMANPQLGQLDLRTLPTLLLQSVEIMHGAGSPLYGTDAVGGVISLRTMSAREAPRLMMTGGYGAFGERRGGVMISEEVGAWSGLVLAEHETAANDFPYVNEALFPPREVHRTNADYERTTLYSSVGYRGGRHDLRLSGWYNAAERGLPGLATTPSSGERQWDEYLRLWADDDVRMPWGTLQLGGFLQQSALRYKNPQLGVDDTGRTLVTSVEAEAHTVFGAHWMGTGAVTGSYGRAAHPALAGSAREGHVGLLGHGTGQYGRLLLYPALRADTYLRTRDDPRLVLSPKMSLNGQLLPGRPLRLKASAGRTFRMPTFNDRYWQPGGNPDLRPERGWSFDTGLFWHPPYGQVELTLYLSYLRDQIIWEPSGQGHYVPRNVRRTRTRGLEASYRGRWAGGPNRHLDAGLFYTFTDARDRSDPASPTYGEPLRYVPRQEVKSYLQGRLGPVGLGLEVRYLGRRFVTGDGRQSLPPVVVMDGNMRLMQQVLGLRTRLTLQVENLLNADYAVLRHRPMPPRHLRLQLTVDFN